MPLQNRVDPFGEIHAVTARGMFTGNRGVIHDPETKALLNRRWSTKAWIICECEFKGFRREPMGRNTKGGNAGWTELFFLDEVTALAAGHRPCFYCRREKAKEFARCYEEALGIASPRAPEIDARLHKERLAAGGKRQPISPEDIAKLPDGAMVAGDAQAYAVRGGRLLPWSFAGYRQPLAALASKDAWLITPPSTRAVLRAGYRPVWHPTAGPG